jgi:hypothetical protein
VKLSIVRSSDVIRRLECHTLALYFVNSYVDGVHFLLSQMCANVILEGRSLKCNLNH